ncbi:MAG: molybdate ABC transporter substrate-binding protein [Epsilonproteobacteria bacterium]|nr:molybdate ABC transporter substrate-binding protein [Campylobacterota bacterium]
MKKGLLILMFLSSFLLAKEFENQKLLLCSGAGLMKPMNEIVKQFEDKTGAKIDVHYGGSGELFSILGTTGCDVFIPGAEYYSEQAIEKGLVEKKSAYHVTKHIPVFVTQKGNPKNITKLSDLTQDGLKIVYGDPRSVAIGKVSDAMLAKKGLREAIDKNIVTQVGTVNQLLVYMAMNQADVAIIWEDMVTWAKEKGKLEIIAIPEDENAIKTILNGVGSMSKNKALANTFNDYMVNSESKKIWEKWGFKL